MIHANIRNPIDHLFRCKHLCCREGVDKAPKAPKGSFVSVASFVDTSSLSTKAGLNKPLPMKKPLIASKTPRIDQDIKMVDLASRRDPDQYVKNAPREFKKLHQLHEKVTKGSSTPVIARKKPTFDFEAWDQPKLSFLDKAAAAKGSSDKPSTDYDDDWMDSLPSPSALLGKQAKRREKESPPHEKSTDYGNSWQDGLPSPSANLYQNDAAIEAYHETDSLEEFDISLFNDNQADIEDALVGFSDSVAMHEDSQAEATATLTDLHSDEITPDEAIALDGGAPNNFERPTNRAETSAKSHASSKLFLSTDSPDQPVEPWQKRKAAALLEPQDLSLSAPVPKRSKVIEGADQALQSSSSAENKALPAVPTGQPAWVSDFDPAFIAEWQDFVEFV